MVKSKEKNALSPDDVTRLLTAIRDIDQSILQLRKLLHDSLKPEIEKSTESEGEQVNPPKTLH